MHVQCLDSCSQFNINLLVDSKEGSNDHQGLVKPNLTQSSFDQLRVVICLFNSFNLELIEIDHIYVATVPSNNLAVGFC